MRSDSTLGIPGLVQAWRAGHVLVANAFGMSVLESPALLAFLPPICERLFGEPLETPAIATWWCGEAAALDDARRRLAEGVIKPAFADASMEPVFVSDLDANARREWAERLGTTPDAYVVEEFLPLSHAPVWHDGRLESRAADAARLSARRRPRRLPRDAGRAVANRRRGSPRRVGAARRQQQGHLGALRRAGGAGPRRSSAARGRARRAASIRRRAARRSTCSGWGDTRSGARTAPGCSARCSAG